MTTFRDCERALIFARAESVARGSGLLLWSVNRFLFEAGSLDMGGKQPMP